MEVLALPASYKLPPVLRQLKAFQHHQTTGELMPPSWEPHKPPLQPEMETLKMAGKVRGVWKS